MSATEKTAMTPKMNIRSYKHMKDMMGSTDSLLPTSEANKLGAYICKQLKEEMGEEAFRKLHYLQKETMMEEYEMVHQKELKKLFPRASL